MLDPESLIPRACGAVDAGKMRAMPLAPIDGYILSRVDGMSTVGDLAAAMSMSVEDVIGSLIKLESLGLVQLPAGGRSSRPPRGKTEAKPRSSPPPRGGRPTRPTPRPAPATRNIPAASQAGASAPPAGPRSTRPPPAKPRNTPPPGATRGSSPPRTPLAPRQEPLVTRAPPPPAAAPPPAPPPRAAPKPRSDPAPQASTSKPVSEPKAAPTPPAAAAPAAPETIELPLEHQQRITTLFAQIETIDHYAVLGIARGLEKKAIKRAYFELTAKFHPDRFFRKKLGPFKAQMEAIFNRMTEAHDTLTDQAKREAYDAYIGSVEQTRSLERMVEETSAEMKRAEAAIGGVESSPPPASGSIQIPPSTGQLPTFDVPVPSAPPSSAPSFEFPKESPTAVSARLSSPDLRTLVDEAIVRDRPSGPRISISPGANTRRDVLARRLTGRNGSAQFKDPSVLSVPAVSLSKTEEAVGSLKRRYEDKVAAARSSQSRKYGESAREALSKGNVVAAANAFRMALTFDPDSAELKEAHENAQRSADQLLSDQYMKQADYEEKADKWADAARSWARVVRARPEDVKAHERAAFCLVKTNGNLHEAAALAQRAVQLSPSNAAIRLTLANVYLAAGLTLNAKRELEVAAQLAPNDATITTLLKRIGKSD